MLRPFCGMATWTNRTAEEAARIGQKGAIHEKKRGGGTAPMDGYENLPMTHE